MAADAMAALEAQLRAGGLQVLGPCERLSQWPGLLASSPLLHDFSAAEADLLGTAMLRVQAAPGQVLIAEGDSSDWLILLLRGTADVGKREGRQPGAAPQAEEEDGTRTRIAVVREGAVLGEMSMFDGEPRYASCRALTEVEAAVLSRAGVGNLVGAHPAVGAKLLVKLTQLLAQRLRNTSNQLVKALRQVEVAAKR